MKASRTFFLVFCAALLGGYIWFVERNRLSPAEKKARDRQAFDLSVNRLDRIRIQTPEVEVEVFHDGTAWMLETPSGARASEPVVRQLLARFRTLGKGEFITPADMRERGLTLADFGLEVPQLRLTLGAGTVTRMYDVGSPNPLGNALYVKEQSSQNVMLVSSDLLEILPEEASVLRDPVIFPLSDSEVRDVTLVGEDGTLRVERDAKTWHIREPRSAPADAEPMAALIRKLLQARIVDGVPEPTAAEMEMFEAERDVIRMTSMNRSVPAEVVVGGDVPGRAELCYASITGQDGLVLVSRGLRVLARTSAAALRDRRVLTFPSEEVRLIRLTDGETEVVLVREAEEWRMRRPLDRPASSARIQTLLEVWSQATVEAFLPEEEGSTEYEDLPGLSFFTDDEGATGQEFVFLDGEMPPGRSRVRRSDDGDVLQVVPDITRQAPADPLVYLSRRILEFDPASVVRVGVVRGKDASQTVYRDPEALAGEQDTPSSASTWVALEEGRIPNPAAVARVVEVFSDLHAERLVTLDPEVARGMGLEDPEIRVSIGLGGETPRSFTMRIQDGFAQIQGQPLVFRLPETVPEALAASLVLPPPDEDAVHAEEETSK